MSFISLLFCRMKHFIPFCLFVVALFAGVTTVSILKSEIVVPKYRLTTGQQNSLPDHHQNNFNPSNLLSEAGVRNGQIRYPNSFQYLSFRVLPSSSKASRIRHSARLEHQKYITGYIRFLLKSAFNQTNGHYLYHLRKLLI